ncbi:MAG: ATP-binding protein [Dokdonella sp.]|nr:ATP-binding protein [Dokdonella sp.]
MPPRPEPAPPVSAAAPGSRWRAVAALLALALIAASAAAAWRWPGHGAQIAAALALAAILVAAATWPRRAPPPAPVVEPVPEPPAIPPELLGELESLRAMQKELVAAKQTAEAATLAKSEFLATMSHEIRTPLNGILPLLDLVLSTPLPPDQRDYLATAHDSAHELLRIVDDILDYSKLEANKLELETVGFDLRELVDSVARLMDRAAGARGLRLTTAIDPSLRPILRGDPARLRQVLTNLVSNAIKFTENGRVAVQISRRNETGTGYWITFAVRDTGIGIAPEIAERLFQPFSQADASTTRVFGGTGLGLAICKRLVDAMGGRIGVRSEPGKGSLFWFDVPLLKAIGDIRQRQDLQGVKALVLCADATTRARIDRGLTTLGLSWQPAGSTAEALALLRAAAGVGAAWNYELVVIDRAGFRSEIRSFLHGLLREAKMEHLHVLVLDDADQLPPDLARGDRVARVARQHEAGELRDALHALLNVKPPIPSLSDPGSEALVRSAGELAATDVDTMRLRGRVLLVEDNAVNRKVAERLLALLGLVVDSCEDGRSALQRLQHGGYDLVLMDCQMPVMDGYAASRAWRRHEASAGLPHVPILAMTANAMPGDREKCLDAGMDEYLSKPLDRRMLVRMLARWLAPAPAEGGSAGAAAQAAAAATPASPALDASIVEDLVDIMGDGFPELVRIYLEETPRRVLQLRDAAAEGDADAIVACAHTLKSSSANLGATGLSELARRIEYDARSGMTGHLEPIAEAAVVEFERVAAALRGLIDPPR